MEPIEKRASKLIDAAKDKLSPKTFLWSAVREMDRGDIETLAVAYLLAQVKNRLRRAVAAVERDAQVTNLPPKRGTAAYWEWLETPEGASAKEYEVERERRESQHATNLMRFIMDSAKKLESELRMQWEDELLRSEFALGDGTKVTWGEATREQHEWRAEMHARNAAAGIEGAARHRAAIATLEETGASNLNEAVRKAA